MEHSYRKTTVKITFAPRFARPKAYEIEHFLREELKIDPQYVIGIHFSITSSVVYLKLSNDTVCDKLVRDHQNGLKFKHSDGNVGAVTIDHAGIRTIRVFELPFEVPEKEVITALQPYGRVLSHVHEKWTTFTTYPVLNGVRQVRIDLTKHVPSYLTIGGCRAIIIYDGQPKTCSGCGKEGHVRSECAQKRITQIPTGEAVPTPSTVSMPLTYAAAIQKDSPPPDTQYHVMDDPAAEMTPVDDTVTMKPVEETPPEQPQQTTATETSMEIDRQVVPTAAFVPNTPDDAASSKDKDAKVRDRKQRSPKRRYKRRRTPSDDSFLRTEEEDHEQADDEDAAMESTAASDEDQHHNAECDGPSHTSETIPQNVQQPDERQPSNSAWADDVEVDPPSVAVADDAAAATKD